MEGLTATARVNHSGSQYADAANTKKLDSYTTLDLGLRYRMRLNADQNEMIWRVGVTNVINEKYWSGMLLNHGLLPDALCPPPGAVFASTCSMASREVP